MFKNNKGYMLVDVIVAMGLLGVSALILYGSVDFMNKKLVAIKTKRQSKDVVAEMINTFSSSASILQVDYRTSVPKSPKGDIVWDTNGEKMRASECPEPCSLKGKMWVTITPVTGQKKLFTVDLKLQHPNLGTKTSSFILGAE